MVSPPRGSDDYVVFGVLIMIVNVSKLRSFVDIAEVMRGLAPRLIFGEVVFTFPNSRTFDVGHAVDRSVISKSRTRRGHSVGPREGSLGYAADDVRRMKNCR